MFKKSNLISFVRVFNFIKNEHDAAVVSGFSEWGFTAAKLSS